MLQDFDFLIPPTTVFTYPPQVNSQEGMYELGDVLFALFVEYHGEIEEA